MSQIKRLMEQKNELARELIQCKADLKTFQDAMIERNDAKNHAEAEIERLKKVVEDAWWVHSYEGKEWNTGQYDAAYKQFKTDNKL